MRANTMPGAHPCGHSAQTHDPERGERVCNDCGMVLEERMPDDRSEEQYRQSPPSPQSRLRAGRLGGSVYDERLAASNTHTQRDPKGLLSFTRICDNLVLFTRVADEAFYKYCKLRKDRTATRAECAVFALFTACRNFGQPVSAGQIQDAIRTFMRVKLVPSVKRALLKLHVMAEELGIGDRRPSLYYFNLEMTHKQNALDDQRDRERLRARALEYYGLLHGHDKSRANRAVDLAIYDLTAGAAKEAKGAARQ